MVNLVDIVVPPFEVEVEAFAKMGVAQFRANPIAAVGNGPVLVVNRDRPSFIAVPVDDDGIGTQSSDEIINARFAAKYEIIQKMRGKGWRRNNQVWLTEIRRHDESLADRAEALGFAK